LIKWLKGFPVPLIGIVNGFVYGLDIFLGGALYGSALPLAYWQAALTVALVINFYTNLAAGLYPALLSGGGTREVEKIFRFAMMLGVPMLFGTIFLGRDILLLLRPAYAEAAPVLYVLALSYWVVGLSGLFAVIVWGKEEVDRKADITFADYVRSGLFRYILAGLLLGILYIMVFTGVALVARVWGWGPVVTANTWAYAHLGLSVAGFVVGYLFSRQKLVFRLPWLSVVRYVVASFLMLALMYPLYLYIPTSNIAAVQFIRVAVLLASGVTAYSIPVILLDREGREMVKLLFNRLVG
jgi:O-antigen/teichoic acid export membrane protein